MFVNIGSLDVMAWFVYLENEYKDHLSFDSLQNLVALTQSLYGYREHKRFVNEDILANKNGFTTIALYSVRFNSRIHTMPEPNVQLTKSLTREQIDTLAEVYGVYSLLSEQDLSSVIHHVGPWSQYYKDNKTVSVIPFGKLVEAWPEYERAARSYDKAPYDKTPSTYQIPKSAIGKFDDMIEKSLQKAKQKYN